jgi:hypothetical protein
MNALQLPKFPSLATTIDLHIGVRGFWGHFSQQNEETMALAINLVIMKLHSRTPFMFIAK